MTQSIGESFSCALVLCYLALMIKEEFQISYGDIFLTAAFEDLRGLDDYIILYAWFEGMNNFFQAQQPFS